MKTHWQEPVLPIEATSNEVIPANTIFYEAFANHCAKPEKEEGYFKRKLDTYSKGAYIRHTHTSLCSKPEME